MSTGFSEAERQIVSTLLETKAVDFEALGAAVAKHGADATFNLDGEDVFCGTMRRFIRTFRLNDVGNPVENLAELSRLITNIQRG